VGGVCVVWLRRGARRKAGHWTRPAWSPRPGLSLALAAGARQRPKVAIALDGMGLRLAIGRNRIADRDAFDLGRRDTEGEREEAVCKKETKMR